MVFTQLHFTKFNYSKTRSHNDSFGVRSTLYGIIALCSIQALSAAQWQEPETSSPWKGLWGQRDDNAIYLGMWTRHLPGHNSDKNNINRLIGINYYGIFGAIFYNSFDIKSYSLGVQRIVYSQKYPHYLQMDFGYRLGFIWGYKDTKMFDGLNRVIPGIKNMNPIFVPQIIGNFSWEVVGIQVSYCWAVVTAGFFIKI